MIGPDRPVAVLEHKGVLTIGRSLLQAYDRLEVLECTAAALVAAREIGTPVALDDEAVRELDNLTASGSLPDS